MKISTKTRIIVNSLIISALFLIYNSVNVFERINFSSSLLQQFLFPTIVAIIGAGLTIWAVEFKLKSEAIFTVPVYVGISSFLFISFLQLVITSEQTQFQQISSGIVLSIVVYIVTYVLSSEINILNLATRRKIPLSQAAKAAHYVLTMLFSYLAFAQIVTISIPLLLKIMIIFIVVFSYSFIALWTIELEYNQRVFSALGIGLMSSFAYIVLALWPIDSFYFALFMTLVFYMNLGMALEIREIISQWIWYEYLLIFLTIIIILLATASWGINGTII